MVGRIGEERASSERKKSLSIGCLIVFTLAGGVGWGEVGRMRVIEGLRVAVVTTVMVVCVRERGV